MTSSLINNSFTASSLINFKSLASNKSVSTSLTEPKAMLRKFINSFLGFLPAPSAMFVGIETAAHRNCEVNPNLSVTGKTSVTKYFFHKRKT